MKMNRVDFLASAALIKRFKLLSARLEESVSHLIRLAMREWADKKEVELIREALREWPGINNKEKDDD